MVISLNNTVRVQLTVAEHGEGEMYLLDGSQPISIPHRNDLGQEERSSPSAQFKIRATGKAVSQISTAEV